MAPTSSSWHLRQTPPGPGGVDVVAAGPAGRGASAAGAPPAAGAWACAVVVGVAALTAAGACAGAAVAAAYSPIAQIAAVQLRKIACFDRIGPPRGSCDEYCRATRPPELPCSAGGRPFRCCRKRNGSNVPHQFLRRLRGRYFGVGV